MTQQIKTQTTENTANPGEKSEKVNEEVLALENPKVQEETMEDTPPINTEEFHLWLMELLQETNHYNQEDTPKSLDHSDRPHESITEKIAGHTANNADQIAQTVSSIETLAGTSRFTTAYEPSFAQSTETAKSIFSYNSHGASFKTEGHTTDFQDAILQALITPSATNSTPEPLFITRHTDLSTFKTQTNEQTPLAQSAVTQATNENTEAPAPAETAPPIEPAPAPIETPPADNQEENTPPITEIQPQHEYWNADHILFGTDEIDIIFTKALRQSADLIYGNGDHDNLRGHNGDDLILGGKGDDTIEGGKGADRLEGGEGNDILYGKQNDDYIDGGSGIDLARLMGKYNQYTYTENEHGELVISGPAKKDGTDTYTNVENFMFSNGQIYSREELLDPNLIGQDNNIIDLSNILEGYDPLNDAITDFVKATKKAGNTIIAVDPDGNGTDHQFIAIATLEGIKTTNEQSLADDGNLILV